MDNYLPFEKYMSNVEINPSCAVFGKLKCNCGCEEFNLFYKGKRTRGFLFPYIVGKNLVLVAKCINCNNNILIYGGNIEENSMKPFFEKGIVAKFKLYFKMNYFEEKMKFENHFTNEYEYICIDGKTNNKKYNSLIEK